MTAAAIPLVPDADEAREWARRELERPEYAAAQPTPLDRIAQAVQDFFERLFGSAAPPGVGSLVLAAFAVLAIALIVAAFIIWGRPRAVRRAAPPFAALFGDDDIRSADRLRADAALAAGTAEWTEAIILRTRALARALQERGLVDLPPGATVHGFARAAAAVFPAQAAGVDAVADVFDDVRYLRRPGTRDGYAQIVRADETLAAARPGLVPAGVGTAS